MDSVTEDTFSDPSVSSGVIVMSTGIRGVVSKIVVWAEDTSTKEPCDVASIEKFKLN